MFFASVIADDVWSIDEPGCLATQLRRNDLLPTSKAQTLAASVARTASSGAPVIFV